MNGNWSIVLSSRRDRLLGSAFSLDAYESVNLIAIENDSDISRMVGPCDHSPMVRALKMWAINCKRDSELLASIPRICIDAGRAAAYYHEIFFVDPHQGLNKFKDCRAIAVAISYSSPNDGNFHGRRLPVNFRKLWVIS